ncbi:hypothetical protein KMP13_02245 [Epibacterium ulvae]|uniref:hypothetical protein n=1 Tax=Epibacterium ulvae TaxID=1156985 RepID=UPI001BFC38AE|nr:hypothetical protein [Epibacterium ulvae]MBT8152734.1 hypothetical protein [Epibacterium ulvae]
MSLEDEIAKLAGRVGGLEKSAETTNDLLAEILNVLKSGTTPPTQDNVVALHEVAKEPLEPVVEEAPETAQEASIGDLREAMLEYGEQYGRPAMAALGARFVPEGKAPKIANIPTDKYAAVIEACGEAPEANAA